MDHHIMPGLGMSCSHCHTLPVGVGTNQFFDNDSDTFSPMPTGPNGELHHTVTFSPLSETPNISIKVPHLRNLHEKVGFDMTQPTSRAGFGFMHDGSVDSLARMMSEPFFNFDAEIDGPASQMISNMVALMLAFSGSDVPINQSVGIPHNPGGRASKDAHAAAGRQVTLDGTNNDDPGVVSLLGTLRTLADAAPDFSPGPFISLTAKGVQGGGPRGYAYAGGGLMQSDRAAESVTLDDLRVMAKAGAEITITAVPRGTELRMGIDRDEDGHYDRDELDACSDPADPESVPQPIGCASAPAVSVAGLASLGLMIILFAAVVRRSRLGSALTRST